MYQADCSSSLVCHALRLLPRHVVLRRGGIVGEAQIARVGALVRHVTVE